MIVDKTDPLNPAAVHAPANPEPSQADAPGVGPRLSIAAVERETGLGKDTLRVWERRYGFPLPERDSSGERAYPAEQVQRLRLIKRLLDAGHRPGRVVKLPLAALVALPAAGTRGGLDAGRDAAASGLASWQAELALIRSHDAIALRAELARMMSRLGLSRFVIEVLAPLTHAVGAAWFEGQLAIREEHLYTEAVQAVLRHALVSLPDPGAAARPRVMLTTFPGEPHVLGLLMAEALLALEGCRCIALGVQTPLAEIACAAASQRADIVGLSFSGCSSPGSVRAGLTELRDLLPREVALWAGGRAAALQRLPPGSIEVVDSLPEVAPALQRWRAARSAA